MPSSKKGLLILLFSCAVQLIYLADSHDDPTFYRPIVDAGTYHQTALQIAEGSYNLNTPYYQPPLFPYFLAFIYKCSGNSMLAAKVVLAIVGALTSLFTYLAGSRLIGTAPAFAAAILISLYGPLLFFNSRFLPAGTATMLTMILILMLLRAQETGTIKRWLLAGICLGTAAICVPNILLFIPAIPVWLFLINNRQLRRPVSATLLVCLGASLAIAPVTLRNYLYSGQFSLISYNGGLNFYIGNNLNAGRTIAIRPGFEWENLDKMPMRNGIYTATEQNRFYIRRALADIEKDPVLFFKRLAYKLRQFTNSRELPRNVDLYVFRQYSPLLSALVWRIGPFGFPFGIIFPLACYGMFMGARQNRDTLLPVLFVIIYAFSVALFFVTARYRVVLSPILCIYAIFGATELWRARQSTQQLTAGLAVIGMLAAWANTPVKAATDFIPFRAEMYTFLALSSKEKGLPEQAKQELETAISIAPDYAEAHNSLGLLLLDQGHPGDAQRSLTRATALKFDYPDAWFNIARASEQSGDMARAEYAYRRAVDASPETAGLHKDLGKFLFFQDRIAEAVPHLQKAISLDVTIYEAYGILAWIMATSPDESFRNGKQALIWARFLLRVQGEENPMLTDTLAAAYAETGDFENAASAEKRAVKLWRSIRRDDLAERALQRLEIYRKGQPFRDSDNKDVHPSPVVP